MRLETDRRTRPTGHVQASCRSTVHPLSSRYTGLVNWCPSPPVPSRTPRSCGLRLRNGPPSHPQTEDTGDPDGRGRAVRTPVRVISAPLSREITPTGPRVAKRPLDVKVGVNYESGVRPPEETFVVGVKVEFLFRREMVGWSGQKCFFRGVREYKPLGHPVVESTGAQSRPKTDGHPRGLVPRPGSGRQVVCPPVCECPRNVRGPKTTDYRE